MLWCCVHRAKLSTFFVVLLSLVSLHGFFKYHQTPSEVPLMVHVEIQCIQVPLFLHFSSTFEPHSFSHSGMLAVLTLNCKLGARKEDCLVSFISTGRNMAVHTLWLQHGGLHAFDTAQTVAQT